MPVARSMPHCSSKHTANRGITMAQVLTAAGEKKDRELKGPAKNSPHTKAAPGRYHHGGRIRSARRPRCTRSNSSAGSLATSRIRLLRHVLSIGKVHDRLAGGKPCRDRYLLDHLQHLGHRGGVASKWSHGAAHLRSLACPYTGRVASVTDPKVSEFLSAGTRTGKLAY